MWYAAGVSRSGRSWVAGVAAAAVAASGAVRTAGAEELAFTIGGGRVTLIAADVPLRDVLDEWARAGGTRFVGVDAVGASPVSLRLEGVAEREALRLLLRPAAGYLAAPRAPGMPGASIYDRVKIRAARRAPQPEGHDAMLKVWGRRNSSNVQKVMWCCGELGLACEREDAGLEFGRTRDPDMLERNPNARVPTVEDDGFVLWESNVVVRYLSARHDAGGLWPEDPRARAEAERWMDWQQTTMLAPMVTIFWGLVRERGRYDAETIAAAIADATAVWRIADRRLAACDWFGGDGFTMADIPLGPQARRWFQIVEDRPEMPALEAWYARLCARPAFVEHVLDIPMN